MELCSVLLVCCQALSYIGAQPLPFDLKESVEQVLAKKDFSGYTYGILDDDRLVAADGRGQIRGLNAQASTLLPILGISKLFTAVAVLQLVENGELTLTDRVFGNHGILYYMRPEHESHMDPRLRDITLRDLLYHTGGWDEFQGPLYDPMLNAFYVRNGYNVIDISREMEVYGILTYDDIIRFMVTQPLQYDPGAKRSESNFGYTLLGRIIEEVTDLPYEDYVKENILRPCGMWHTRIGPSYSSTHQARESNIIEPGRPPKMGYIPLDTSRTKSLFDIVPPLVLGPCLGWHSNVYDMSRFLTALLQTTSTDILLLDTTTIDGLILEPGYTPDPELEPWDGIGVASSYAGEIWHKSFHSDIGINVGFYYIESPFSNEADGSTVGSDLTVIYFGVSRSAKPDIILDLMTWTEHADLSPLVHKPNIIREDLTSIDINVSGNEYLVVIDLDEHRLGRYLDALRLADCLPIWISGYTHRGHTNFVIVSKVTQKAIDLDFIVLEKSDKDHLLSNLHEELEYGYQLKFLHSFTSTAHDEGLNHLAILTKDTNPPYVKYDIASDIDAYFTSIEEGFKSGLLPEVQSVDVADGDLIVSYLLRESTGRTEIDESLTYIDLGHDAFKQTVEENAGQNYILRYLDTFIAHGESRFAAIFRKKTLTEAWAIRHEVPAESLLTELDKWQQLEYVPSIITGYSKDKKLYFVVLFTMAL